MLFILKSLYIYHLILFSKVIICILLNVSMKNNEKYFVIRSFGVHVHLSKFCRVTCLFVGMLKGYMVKKGWESLG